MSTALTIYDDGKFELMQRTASALSTSGYFADAKQQAQAVVKVMAGAELGLPPFASMTGIHIIQGKPALGANVIATLIKNDPRYNYRVTKMTDDICEIVFFEDGQECGTSTFTADDAKRANVKNMNKFPRNMLFARAISNGAKWYTPGIFGGAVVYTPDELGANVDEDGVIIESSFVESPPNDSQHEQPTMHPNGDKPVKQAPNGATIHSKSDALYEALRSASDGLPVSNLVADVRDTLEETGNGYVTCGDINTALVAAKLYPVAVAALRAVKLYLKEHKGELPADYDIEGVNGGTKFKKANGLKIYDWLVDRKAVGVNNGTRSEIERDLTSVLEKHHGVIGFED